MGGAAQDVVMLGYLRVNLVVPYINGNIFVHIAIKE